MKFSPSLNPWFTYAGYFQGIVKVFSRRIATCSARIWGVVVEIDSNPKHSIRESRKYA